MYNAIDTTQIDRLPKRDENPANAAFFIIFILVGSIFAVSLFVGVVFDNFIRLRDDILGISQLTTKQKRWIKLKKTIMETRPVRFPLPPSMRIHRRICCLKQSTLNKIFPPKDKEQSNSENDEAHPILYNTNLKR